MDLALPTPRPRLPHYFRLALAAHLALVSLIALGAYLGLLPTAFPDLPHADLFAHALLIGPLALLLDGALAYRLLPRPLPSFRLAPLLVLAGAGLEEFAQRFSARRTSAWSDFLADLAGVALFAWLSKRLAAALA
jgi:hypothetical protein